MFPKRTIATFICTAFVSSCTTTGDESAPNLAALRSVEVSTLFDACRSWITSRTDITNSLQGKGYSDEPVTFGSRLNGGAYVKALIGKEGRRGAEIATTKIECRVLFTFMLPSEKEVPKELRSEFGQRFQDSGYEYSGLKKTGPYGFIQRWEAFQKGDEILLIQGKVNLRDGEVTFRFANLKDVPQ